MKQRRNTDLPLLLVIQPKILRKRHCKNGHVYAVAIHVIVQAFEVRQQKQSIAVTRDAFFDGVQAGFNRCDLNVAAGGALHK